MRRRCILSVLMVTLLALGSVVGVARPARAAQAGPSWTAGDSWTWRWIYGSTASTLTWTVEKETTLTAASQTYDVWEVEQTLVMSGPLTNETDAGAVWIETGGLTIIKQTLQTDKGFFASSWNPPLLLAEFPLEGRTWTLATNETDTTPTPFGSEYQSFTITYYGQALAEAATAVTAGTFRAIPVQLSTGTASSTVRYYSDEVGNFVLIEDYDSGTVVRTQTLLNYRYQSATLPWVFLGLGIAAAVGVASWLIFRRRRNRPTARVEPPPTEAERRR